MNLLDILFPKRCVGCGRIGKYFCDRCRSTIRVIKENEVICPMCGRPALDGLTHPRCQTLYSLDRLTSFFHYDGIIRKAIKSIKYGFVSDLALEFINLIPTFFPKLYALSTKPSILIPIPLHPSRLRFRGFNQAEKLGSVLAQKLHIPIQTDILRRTVATEPQVEMQEKKKRLQNMINVFSTQNSQFTIHNSNIILFDDVFTTGATMRAAANVLKRSGIKHVWGVTMAR